jgi:hypothetical protein
MTSATWPEILAAVVLALNALGLIAIALVVMSKANGQDDN